MYSKEISKETFKGNWPFTVDNGLLINNGNAILFEYQRKKFNIEFTERIAINGLAITNKRKLKAKEMPTRLAKSINTYSVNDIISAGLNLNQNYD